MAENASLARSIGVVAVVLGRSAGAMADVQTDDAGCLGRAVFSSSGRRGQLSRDSPESHRHLLPSYLI